MTKYFGSNNCPAIMELLTEAITETVTEFGAAKILGYFINKKLKTLIEVIDEF